MDMQYSEIKEHCPELIAHYNNLNAAMAGLLKQKFGESAPSKIADITTVTQMRDFLRAIKDMAPTALAEFDAVIRG